MRNNAKNTKNNICAICIDTETIPVKPNTAAISAITKNVSAQFNMFFSLYKVNDDLPKDNVYGQSKFRMIFGNLFQILMLSFHSAFIIRPKFMKGFDYEHV
jgi:hypothetical protein